MTGFLAALLVSGLALFIIREGMHQIDKHNFWSRVSKNFWSFTDIKPPEHFTLELEAKVETKARVELDRTNAFYVHLRVNDGMPSYHGVDPLTYDMVGDRTVLLTPAEAMNLGLRMMDFAMHVVAHPDLRKKRKRK